MAGLCFLWLPEHGLIGLPNFRWLFSLDYCSYSCCFYVEWARKGILGVFLEWIITIHHNHRTFLLKMEHATVASGEPDSWIEREIGRLRNRTAHRRELCGKRGDPGCLFQFHSERWGKLVVCFVVQIGIGPILRRNCKGCCSTESLIDKHSTSTHLLFARAFWCISIVVFRPML